MVRRYERCPVCRKVVMVNKPLVGSLHICAPQPRPEEALAVRPA